MSPTPPPSLPADTPAWGCASPPAELSVGLQVPSGRVGMSGADQRCVDTPAPQGRVTFVLPHVPLLSHAMAQPLKCWPHLETVIKTIRKQRNTSTGKHRHIHYETWNRPVWSQTPRVQTLTGCLNAMISQKIRAATLRPSSSSRAFCTSTSTPVLQRAGDSPFHLRGFLHFYSSK